MSSDTENMENPLKNELKSIDKQIQTLQEKRSRITKQINSLQNKREHLINQLKIESFKLSSRNWGEEKFSFSDTLQTILEQTFKLKKFHKQQLAAINAYLNKNNVLLLMPTGGGKSLCYQLPAVFSEGVTLVVSPLVSLMEDQIYQLKKLNINAKTMSSNTSKEEKKLIFDYLIHNKGERICLIYVTPEWLAKSKRFMSALQKCHAAKKFDGIAVDEVHCVSTWGHDFRPDYTYLSLMKSMFADVPMMGLTATATNAVLSDVQKVLDIPDSVVIKAPFDRPNLFFTVIPKPESNEAAIQYLVQLLKNEYKNQSGIIYTATIKDCEEIATELRKHGLLVKPYHADLDKQFKTNIHEKWLNNEIQAIVGTIAFGMGIDKPDVRFVIHYTMPKSMESLYQEAGRAGRDGKKAYCTVLYKLGDYLKQSAYTNSKEQLKNVKSILDYCLNLTECRHKLIGKHFQEVTLTEKCNSMCDNCTSDNNIEYYNVADVAKTVINIIKKETNGENNLTLKKLLDVWLKKKDRDLLLVAQAEFFIGSLIKLDYIKEERSYTAYSVNTYLRCGDKIVKNCLSIPFVKKTNLDRYFGASKKRKIEEVESDEDFSIID